MDYGAAACIAPAASSHIQCRHDAGPRARSRGSLLMLSRPNTALSQIHLQIMWSRLIAVVEEQAQTLVRTAFSTPVREAGDLSAGVFDRDGKMLAQAVTGTPGDVLPLAACNDEGSRRLVKSGEQLGLANLDRRGEHIIGTSRAATIEAIGTLRPGKYKNSVSMDGYDRPLTLVGEMTIGPDGIHVDYTGTSPASAFGINVVMNYTLAYTAFGVKCLVAPEVPNNAGSLAPITTSAPEGCLLNVKRPRAVAARHTVGHMLPDVVFGCLHQVMAGGVPAEGASSLWNPQIYGGADVSDELGPGDNDGHALGNEEVAPFSTVIFHCGGTGARPGKDGLD